MEELRCTLSLVVILATVVSGSLNDGLLAYFPFDGNLNEYVHGLQNGVPLGSPTFVPGISGSAIHLNGYSDCVQVPNPLGIFEPPSISVVVWAKFTPTQNTSIELLIDTTHGGYTGWVMQYFRDQVGYYAPGDLAFTRGNGTFWNEIYPNAS
jgi:hypothetical protein